jgi:hypothetical protein
MAPPSIARRWISTASSAGGGHGASRPADDDVHLAHHDAAAERCERAQADAQRLGAEERRGAGLAGADPGRGHLEAERVDAAGVHRDDEPRRGAHPSERQRAEARARPRGPQREERGAAERQHHGDEEDGDPGLHGAILAVLRGSSKGRYLLSDSR